MSGNTLLILTLAIPLLGTCLIFLTGKSPNLREACTLATAGLLFIVNVAIAQKVLVAGESASLSIAEFVPGGALHLAAEPLGIIFGLIASGLWIVTSIYSIG